eukprot:2709876-Lingulodinium_polyedra.AAC.1
MAALRSTSGPLDDRCGESEGCRLQPAGEALQTTVGSCLSTPPVSSQPDLAKMLAPAPCELLRQRLGEHVRRVLHARHRLQREVPHGQALLGPEVA